MAVALDVVDDAALQVEAVPPAACTRRGNRTPRVVIAVGLLIVLGVLVFVLGNERQATTQFDLAHDALVQTNGRIVAMGIELAGARRDLQILKVQISSSETTLSSDSATLQSVRTALVQAQQDASDKSSYIANLETCQGGVQQALNALSVGDENHAVSALNDVSAACQSVTGSGG